MKKFRLIGLALIAVMLSFSVSSCSDDDNFISVDYSKDLVGTWTCLDADYAEVLVISADGSVLSAGVDDGESWENLNGTIKVENNKMELLFGEKDDFKGRFEMIPGETFVIIEEGTGDRFTYRYCKEDLSEEILGMWIAQTKDYTMIMHIEENNKFVYTGSIDESSDYNYIEPGLSKETNYKLLGDIFCYTMIINDQEISFCNRLSYSEDGSVYGDVLRLKGSKGIESSFLRVKQNLELPTEKYNYKSTYISNAKGEGVINIDGYNFDFSKIDGVTVDKLFKTLLYTLEFPTTDSLTYSYTLNGTTYKSTVPVLVEGNKMTVHMDKSEGNYRDMDLYVFQDKDNSQMHIYMSKNAFINFFGNTALSFAAKNNQIDPTNATAVNGLFNQIESHVTSINASFVLTKSK